MMELFRNTPGLGELDVRLIERIAPQNQQLKLTLGFLYQTRSMTTSTRWNSFRSE
jgi:hypothetical protein